MKDVEVPQDLAALFEAERNAPNAPAAVEDRVRARLAATLPMAPSPASTPPASTRLSSWVGEHGRTVALLAVGAAAGAGGHAFFSSPEVKVHRVVVEVPVPVRETSSTAPTPAPLEPASLLPESKVKVSRRARAGRIESDLARERALIERIRTAVTREDGEGALATVESHERLFPSGHLAEEREALAIQALILAGRHASAELRASRFHRRHPQSIFSPVVDAMLEERGRRRPDSDIEDPEDHR